MDQRSRIHSRPAAVPINPYHRLKILRPATAAKLTSQLHSQRLSFNFIHISIIYHFSIHIILADMTMSSRQHRSVAKWWTTNQPIYSIQLHTVHLARHPFVRRLVQRVAAQPPPKLWICWKQFQKKKTITNGTTQMQWPTYRNHITMLIVVYGMLQSLKISSLLSLLFAWFNLQFPFSF